MQHTHNSWHNSSVLKYLVLHLADASEEDEDGNEEANAEVQVDCGAGALDGVDEAKGQYADEEADEGQGEPHHVISCSSNTSCGRKRQM